MRIVLVRPRDPNNIGAVARAMANFGLTDLVLVAPFEPTWVEARSAVGARTVLQSAVVAGSLAAAIGDCTLVGATTAGTRRVVDGALTPEQFAAAAAGVERVALVFGNEKHGLTATDIGRCHSVVTIPTSREQPSMNLAQAVAVCCYEFCRGRVADVPSPRAQRTVASLEAIEHLVEQAVPESGDAGTEGKRAAARERFRKLLLRSHPTDADVSLLRGLLAPGRRTRR